MSKKIITIITAVAVFLSLFSINVSAAQTTNLSGGQLLKQYALEDSIVDETIMSTELTTEDKAAVNAAYLQSYIDSNVNAEQAYGGRYIGDDGKLHVLFTENVQNSIIDSVNTMTESEAIYEQCEYTLDELIALKEYIGECLLNFDKTNQNVDVVSVGVYEQYNKIFVGIKDCNQEKIKTFKKYITNSAAVEFENAEKYDYCININAGSSVGIGATASTAGGYSVGFRCRYLRASGEYIYGFMTAGHGNSAGDFAFVGGTQIGYVAAWSHNNNSAVDNAFVYVNNSNYTTTNTMIASAGVLVAGAYATTYTTGATVYKVGNTTNLTSGKITSTSYQYTFGDGTTKKDLVQIAARGADGDSGGTVYSKSNGSNYITGTCEAAATNGSSLLFVKITNIKDIFDITLY